ncbi:unnamed protein product [Adineta ricciae]|uniref:Uncharacterized protein n=1 Tax=Adineta ricciae TaxID=249248 RepID=A0A814B4I9_ADIRI|nr:unnamed protein product [Adineta ricciae]
MARRFYVFSVIVLCQASRKIQLKEKKKKLKSKGILSGVFVLSRTTTCANPVNCLIDPCQGATRRNYTNAVSQITVGDAIEISTLAAKRSTVDKNQFSYDLWISLFKIN